MYLEDAKVKETYNKVFARGKIVGFGKNDYGMKRFVLYVRGRTVQNKEKNPLYMSVAFGTDVNRDYRVEGKPQWMDPQSAWPTSPDRRKHRRRDCFPAAEDRRGTEKPRLEHRLSRI